MANPFEKRATEYLRDDAAFLPLVTPEPLETFLRKPAKEGRLFDRLAVIVGTPGSGKTTLARVFQYSTLHFLSRNRTVTSYKPLLDTLTSCRALDKDRPLVAGARVPLEAEYREFWEFPYPDELKFNLMVALLQARAVLVWLRNFANSGISLEDVRIVPKDNADAALASIGGCEAESLLKRAREVELAIYKISAALMPPTVDEIDGRAVSGYRPFDVIECFQIKDSGETSELLPLIIFDDAHSLHPQQFSELQRWLARRELRVSRWILTRLDALTPNEVLVERGGDESHMSPGMSRTREITHIQLQGSDGRSGQRRAFRKMAKDMADRYMRQMPIFNRRGLHSLSDLLGTEPEVMSAGKQQKLAEKISSKQESLGISSARRSELERIVSEYLSGSPEDREEMRLGMLSILMSRYANRIPQRNLFESVGDAEPSKPLTADSGVAEGARIHLLHEYDRPVFYGIDALCDASSENAELFLRLASRLVSQAETLAIRRGNPVLRAGLQNTLLRERAGEVLRDWDFPHHIQVRKLADAIAAECMTKTLEENAPLDGGASAVGIPQDEFEQIPSLNPGLARVLQFGVAYNAFSLVQHHSTKNRLWCKIELGGALLLHHGLTLKRGGFIERTARDLTRMLGES